MKIKNKSNLKIQIRLQTALTLMTNQGLFCRHKFNIQFKQLQNTRRARITCFGFCCNALQCSHANTVTIEIRSHYVGIKTRSAFMFSIEVNEEK